MPRRRAALVGFLAVGTDCDFIFAQHFKQYLNSLLWRDISF